MAIVLAAPLAVPDISHVFTTLRMTWTGFDGSEWGLSDRGTMPVLATGVKGLHTPPMTRYKSTSPLVPGSELTGYAINDRPVYWPLIFKAGSADEWRRQYAGFFRSVHPVNPGVWTVGEGDSARTLEVTGVFDDDYQFTYDPFLQGAAMIGVDLEATRPLWRGRTVSVPFAASESTDWIPPEGAPAFHKSPVATFDNAHISNTGDEPAYVTWTIEGPLTGVTVGVGGAFIDVPDVADGDVVVVDTDPASGYATLNGDDYSASLGFQVFAPVPVGGKQKLRVASSGGTGTVTAQITPLYWSAF